MKDVSHAVAKKKTFVGEAFVKINFKKSASSEFRLSDMNRELCLFEIG